MISSKHHIIQKLILEITFPSEAMALEFKEEGATYFWEEIYTKLTKVLDDWEEDGKTISVDKLTMDVGQLANTDWQERIPVTMVDKANSLWQDQRNGVRDTKGLEKKDNTQSAWEQLFFFLEKGYFSWNQRAIREIEKQLLRQPLDQKQGVRLKDLLRTYPGLIQRLCTQFSPQLLAQISTEWGLTLANGIYETLAGLQFRDHALPSLWEVVFFYLIDRETVSAADVTKSYLLLGLQNGEGLLTMKTHIEEQNIPLTIKKELLSYLTEASRGIATGTGLVSSIEVQDHPSLSQELENRPLELNASQQHQAKEKKGNHALKAKLQDLTFDEQSKLFQSPTKEQQKGLEPKDKGGGDFLIDKKNSSRVSLEMHGQGSPSDKARDDGQRVENVKGGAIKKDKGTEDTRKGTPQLRKNLLDTSGGNEPSTSKTPHAGQKLGESNGFSKKTNNNPKEGFDGNTLANDQLQKGLKEKRKNVANESPPIREQGPLIRDLQHISRPQKDTIYTFPSKSTPQTGEEIYIPHAGLVLLHPFLQYFYRALGWEENKKWKDEASQEKAVLMLGYLATGRLAFEEHELPLQKLLCGMPIAQPVQSTAPFDAEELAEAENMLKAVIKNWGALKNTGPDGLRDAFLMREGKLIFKENGWTLTVAANAMDVLLNKLPWGIGIVKLPWMKEMLWVEWA